MQYDELPIAVAAKLRGKRVYDREIADVVHGIEPKRPVLLYTLHLRHAERLGAGSEILIKLLLVHRWKNESLESIIDDIDRGPFVGRGRESLQSGMAPRKEVVQPSGVDLRDEVIALPTGNGG